MNEYLYNICVGSEPIKQNNAYIQYHETNQTNYIGGEVTMSSGGAPLFV